jgi:16S rRNA (cytosine967-C5)-methyltransferase
MSVPESAAPSSFRPSEHRMRPVLLDLWAQTRADWRFVSERLADAFRQAKHLHSAERRLVAELIYGLVRRTRTINEVLALAGCPEPPPEPGREPSPRRALIEVLTYRLLYESLGRDDVSGAAPEIDWKRVIEVHARLLADPDPVRRIAWTSSLPDWLAERFIADYGDEAPVIAESLNTRAPLVIRANRIRIDREQLAKMLAEEHIETRPCEFAVDGLEVVTRTNVFGLKAFQSGLFEVQDEASQLVAELVAASPGSTVIDACAGAGGKTLALASAMRSRGRLLALDIHRNKLDELSRRARRAGLSHHRAVVIPAEGALPPEVQSLVGRCDRVLVDAPCDGVGSMRRHPEVRWRMERAFVDALPELQFNIAMRVAPLVKPGGRLVYATCTIFEAENGAVVERLKQALPDFEPVAVKEVLGKRRATAVATPDGMALATLPHRQGMDGFFAAVLRRRSEP